MRRAAAILLVAACARSTTEPCDSYVPPRPVAFVVPAFLDEISGLAVSSRNPDVLWLIEDSAGDAAVYALHRDGRLAATLTIANATNIDWEAVAIGPCANTACLFVGDIGDGLNARDDAAIWRVEEPFLDDSPTDLTLTAEYFPYRYPSGAQDAEAMVVRPDGMPVIFTKRDDGSTTVFAFPRMTANAIAVLDEVATISTTTHFGGLPSQVTDASLWPDGTRLLVRTYFGLWELFLDDTLLVSIGMAHREARGTAIEHQAEAIAYDVVTGGYWSASEGTPVFLSHAGCW